MNIPNFLSEFFKNDISQALRKTFFEVSKHPKVQAVSAHYQEELLWQPKYSAP